MFKGTPSFPAGKLDVLVEKEWGGQTNAYTSLDRTCYYLENLEAASLDTALHACGELAFMANIDHEPFDGAIVVKEDGTTEKIKGERDVVLQEIRDSAEELSSRQGEKMLSMAYPNQPHGKTVLGPAEVVSRLTFEDMRAYRDTYYVPNNAVFCAVGPVKHADVVASITNKFGALTARNFPDTPLPVYVGNTQVIKSDRVETTTVFLAAEGKPLGHKVEAALNALGMLMTSGDSSRLYNDLVNEKEACLTLFSGCESYRSAGFFVTAFVAEAENIQTIIGETFKEIRSLSENVSDEKLDEIKIMMEFDLIAQQEKNSSACDFYACAVQDYGRLMTMQDMVAEIRAITVDDIKAAAKSVLASNPTACIMTPENTPPQYLPTHQTIVELRDGRTPKLPTQTPTLDII